MTFRLLILVAGLALLALAPAAPAKEIVKAELCGTDRCIDFTDDAEHTVLEGTPVPPPDAPSKFVELNYRVRGDAPPGEKPPTARFTNQLELSGGLIRGESGTWLLMNDEVRGRLKRLAGRVEWFPAKKLSEIAPEIENASIAPVPDGALGPPGPNDLVTPGQEEAGGGGDGGGLGTLPLAALIAGALVAAGLGVARLGGRRRRAAPPAHHRAGT